MDNDRCSCAGRPKIVTTEAWKIERYQELAFEVGRMHRVEVIVVPLVIRALGTVSKDFAKWQEYLGIPNIVGRTQMWALLATAHILRKVLYLWAAEWSEIYKLRYPAGRCKNWRESHNNKLTERNLISVICVWAAGVVRCSAGILEWTMEELGSTDRKTRKI